MAYINQTEINNFINKAQQKIALLGSIIATSTEDDLPYEDELALSDELSSLINSLIDPWLDWDEKDIMIYIHFYNNKAKITDIPFSNIPKLRMQVVWPEQLVNGTGDVTQAELDAEIAARIAGDNALQVNIDVEKTRIDNLDFAGDLAAALSEYTKTVLLFLPTGDNKTALESLTTALVAEIAASTLHVADGGIHVTSGEKTYWNAKVQPDDPRLSDARTPTAHQHPVSDVTGLITEVQTQVDAYVTALNLQDGITPAFSAANVIEGTPLAISIDDTGGPTNLILNMTVPPPEKGDQGDPFIIGAQGLAADRFDSVYNVEDANFSYLGTDDGNLYFRTPLGGDATSTAGWSAGTPFTGKNGWSPVLATQTVNADKEVFVILDWIGGTGNKPVFTPPSNPPDPLIWYVGPGGPTVFINDATNIKGGKGNTGVDGDRFTIDDTDLLANIPSYDGELKGFTLLITDVSPNVIYQKNTDTSGDWGGPYEWQGPIGPSSGGDVYKVGTPANNQIGVWTGDGTIEGDNGLTYTGTSMIIGDTINIEGASANRFGVYSTLASTSNAVFRHRRGSNSGIGGNLDQLSLIIAGVEAVRINTTRQVGIGIIPSTNLHIGAGSGGIGSGIRLELQAEGSATTSYTSIDFDVPNTGLIGQFLATANNYSNAGLNLPANSVALANYNNNGAISLISGGTNGSIIFTAGGYDSSFEVLRLSSDQVVTVSGDGFVVPASANANRKEIQGSIRYSTTTNNFEGYDGVSWLNLQASGGGSQTPWVSPIDAAGFSLFNIASISDSNSNSIIAFSEEASAVNYFGIKNSATGNDLLVESLGTDLNVGINIKSKGFGQITLDQGDGDVNIFAAGIALGDPNITNIVGQGIYAAGGALNISMTINPKGNGVVSVGGTSATEIASGTTAERPAFPSQAMIRFNETTSLFEGYNGTAWVNLS